MEKFFSCDWGTSTFRLRLVDTINGEVAAELKTNEGIAETHQQWLISGRPETDRIDFYRQKLMDAINRVHNDITIGMPVIISGMASSGIGLTEIPYHEFPFTWDISQFPVKKIDADKKFLHPLYLVSGFKTDKDVMRGEESLLLGCDVNDEEEKVFIFPGTHSKHIFVKNKLGTDFKTYMTGEIFNLLSEKSILRHAVKNGADETSFSDGFKEGLKGDLLHQIFMVRTRQLLQNAGTVSGYQFLSGLLIGAELSQLKGKQGPVYVVCSETLKHAYLKGLKLLEENRNIFYLNADEIIIKSHIKIADHFFKQ